MKFTRLGLLVVLIYNSQFGLAQQDCKLRKNEQGIKVYLCETEGSDFKTIKVAFRTHGNLAAYAGAVLDVKGYTKWQSNITNIRILKIINLHELIYYSEVETPWPIAHRDLIFHLILKQDSLTKKLQVTLEQLPEYIPKKNNIVRIPEAKSILKVTPLKNNLLEVNYTIHVDPGGQVPAILANLFAANTPWQTFYNFKNLLESGAFNNLQDTDIKNLE